MFRILIYISVLSFASASSFVAFSSNPEELEGSQDSNNNVNNPDGDDTSSGSTPSENSCQVYKDETLIWQNIDKINQKTISSYQNTVDIYKDVVAKWKNINEINKNTIKIYQKIVDTYKGILDSYKKTVEDLKQRLENQDPEQQSTTNVQQLLAENSALKASVESYKAQPNCSSVEGSSNSNPIAGATEGTGTVQ